MAKIKRFEMLVTSYKKFSNTGDQFANIKIQFIQARRVTLIEH